MAKIIPAIILFVVAVFGIWARGDEAEPIDWPCDNDDQCLQIDVNSICDQKTNECTCIYGRNENVSQNCYPKIDTIIYQNCAVVDFDNETSCTLWCAFNATNYQCDSYTWIYHNGDANSNYTFPDATNITIDNIYFIYNTTLTLDEYYSGYYRCQFNVNNSTAATNSTSHDFKISNTTGINMAENCDDTWQCMAINSFCDEDNFYNESICNCHTAFRVPYDDEPNTPACLEPAYFGDICQTGSQCAYITPNSICINETCVCGSNYTINENGLSCDLIMIDDSGMSGGEIAGIVIAGIVVVAVIISGFCYYSEKPLSD